MGQIVQKGQYSNITNIDMSSAVLSTTPQVEVRKVEDKKLIGKQTDDRSKSIIAQVMVKGAVEMYASEEGGLVEQGEYLCDAVKELVGAYKVAMKEL